MYCTYSYKGYGAAAIDKTGTRDRNEFYNVSKDDVLALDPSFPPLAASNIPTAHRLLQASFICSAHAIVSLLLSHLNAHLRLPHGTLDNLHRLEKDSGDQIRFVKAPP